MGTKYDSVLKLIEGISTDNAFKGLATSEITDKKLAKFLFCLRCVHRLSQKQLAKKIGCTQSRISKIENAFDKDLSMRDLLDYGKALNLHLEIGYRHPSVRIVDLIKYHAFKIKAYLNELSGLAKGDEVLKKSISDFHIEALFNIMRIISESLGRIDLKRKGRKKDRSVIHISPPLEKTKLEQLVNQGQK